MKYQDWTKSLAEDTLKRALKTADKVLNDADEVYLDSDEIDKLHHTWEVIELCRHICQESEEKEETNYMPNNFNQS